MVNKPQGMVVHPAAGNFEGTLVNALLYHCDDLSDINGVIRPGIVHRIDKDTTGLLVVAKNNEAHNFLSEQLKEHKIKGTYIAVIEGTSIKNSGTINLPIGRHPVERKKMAINEKNGKEAITHFKVIKRFPKHNCSLLEVKIETGRTHQIRVHLAEIGYPIVGDGVYSNGRNPFGVEGQMLHAKSLEFKHPVTGKIMKLEAPLPEYFESVLKELEN